MTLTNTTELLLQRNATKRFIEADPTTIVLLYDIETWVDGSKKVLPDSSRVPQQFKISWGGESGIVRAPGPDGGVRSFDCVLIGKHDAIIEMGDYWYLGTQKFVVEYVSPSNGWEVKAGAVSHGSKPT